MKKLINITIITLIALPLACTTHTSEENKKSTNPTKATQVYALVEKGGVAVEMRLPGQFAAFQEVSIFPKINGYVKNVWVDLGSKVQQGSPLMNLEAPELEQAVLQAKERYARSRADFSLDKERYSRLVEASATAGAISPIDLSTIRAKMDADSALCNAEKANWKMQQDLMGYLQVSAPFEGVITERNVHPGALVSASTRDKPMLELKQTIKLRLQVDIPENVSVSLKNNDTVTFFVAALSGKKFTATISRKSNNVSNQYRTERVEIDVPNPNALLTPGMFADVLIHIKGNVDAFNVPKTAVITTTERKYITLKRNNQLTKIDVRTGNENVDRVEIVGNINVGDSVVAVGGEDVK